MSIAEKEGVIEKVDAFPVREFLTREEILGLEAPVFWNKFLACNSGLLMSGCLAEYPIDLANQHGTHPHKDHAPRPCTTPIANIVDRLNGMERLDSAQTIAISHTYEIVDARSNGNPKFTGLIGFDLEVPRGEDFLASLTSTFGNLQIPVVIFDTGASYFASCFDNAYGNDFTLARKYGKMVEAIVSDYEPHKLSWINQFTDPLKACGDRETLERVAWLIQEKVGHLGDDNCACVDLRHFKSSVLANDLRRGMITRIPYEPYLVTQFFMRVGQKRGNDTPKVVYSSENIPIRLGKSIRFDNEV
jgi:hypothetical protein